MKEIIDKNLMNELINAHPITEHISKKGISFKLYQYENGEILSHNFGDTVLIKFLVKGSILIYALRSNGTKYPIRYIEKFTMLGDIELYENRESHFLTEAKSEVLCLTIPLDENRDLLLNDDIFLKYIIKSLSEKLVLFSESEAKFNTFEERFLDYIKKDCPDNTIHSVETTLFQLRCSRRQLQRVLKKLVEENVIEKLGKGCYKLIKKDN